MSITDMFNLFKKEFENYLKPSFYFEAQTPPTDCLNQLIGKKNVRKQCLKLMKKKTENGFKIIRRLTFAHILLIHSNNMFAFVESFTEETLSSSNDWLNQNIIFPYYRFIRKALSSREMYVAVKSGVPEFSFDKMFYLYQLFNELFTVVKKMSLLGRYYKENNNALTCTFVEVIAYQAQRLYVYYKNSLTEVISYPKRYLHSRSDEELLKVIIEECLPLINQQMKKLFLDKYFYPYGKGIYIKLFKTEEQNEHCSRIINGIVNDHKDTQRRNIQQNLERTLFPEQGKVNLQFYEQSLMAKSKRDQIFMEEEEVEEIDLASFKNSMKKEALKETSDYLQKCEDV